MITPKWWWVLITLAFAFMVASVVLVVVGQT